MDTHGLGLSDCLLIKYTILFGWTDMKPKAKLITGDILKVAKRLGQVDCVVTSPPYYKQRDYGHAKQLGQERTLQG